MSGKWIVPGTYGEKDRQEVRLFYFKKKIVLEKKPERLLIRITADSRYKLYLNGKFCEVGPEEGDTQKWYLDELDISDFLQTGENEILVKVLHEPEDTAEGCFHVFRIRTPGLYIDCICEEFCTNESWSSAIVPDFVFIKENPFFAPLQIHEKVSGKIPAEQYDWQTVSVYSEEEVEECLKPGHLFPRDIPFMHRECKKMVTVDTGKEYPGGMILIPGNQKYEIELNAGELQCGYWKLVLSGGKDAVIKILNAESYVEYKPDVPEHYGDQPRKGDRSDWKNGVLAGYTDTYTVGGYGKKDAPEIYEPFFFRTFRYVKITVETGDEALELLDFSYEMTGYPLQVVRVPENLSEIQQQIWDISLRTLQRCMHETYMDCPFYERLQYVMDSRSQMIFTYAISDDDRLARRCMDDMARSQYSNGLLNACYPSLRRNVIPGFSIYFIGMLYDHMLFKKEKGFLQKYMETAERILAFFDRNRNAQGIVDKIGGLNQAGNDWSFIDWTPEWKDTSGVPTATLKGPITMESMLYLLGLQYMKELLVFTGNSEKAEIYDKKAEELAAAINRTCLGKNQMYKDGPDCEIYSQHTQVFAVLTGLMEPSEGKKILVETLRNKEKYAQCSVAMLYYLFRALEICDAYEETTALWKIYEDMLKKHLTTCEEGSFKSRSDCHAWGALALYEFLHMEERNELR